MKPEDLSDAPLNDEPRRDADVETFCVWVEALLEDSAYDFAAQTLDGILKTVKRTGRVTENQKTAVENIHNGVLRREENERRHRRSRRYEGWGGGR